MESVYKLTTFKDIYGEVAGIKFSFKQYVRLVDNEFVLRLPLQLTNGFKYFLTRAGYTWKVDIVTVYNEKTYKSQYVGECKYAMGIAYFNLPYSLSDFFHVPVQTVEWDVTLCVNSPLLAEVVSTVIEVCKRNDAMPEPVAVGD